jgi:hypothetical protein
MRTMAASAAPGPRIVSPRTRLSYCSQIQRFEARSGQDSSLNSKASTVSGSSYFALSSGAGGLVGT